MFPKPEKMAHALCHQEPTFLSFRAEGKESSRPFNCLATSDDKSSMTPSVSGTFGENSTFASGFRPRYGTNIHLLHVFSPLHLVTEKMIRKKLLSFG
jgi:hypothetical protein